MRKYIISLYVKTDIPIVYLRDKEVWQRTLDKARRSIEHPAGNSMKIVSVKIKKGE